uniref:Uncharacterized protein n=1 Tax=Moniliophthora roreri TaxID=221103 RepID=A0A0W0FK61_MONRR
MALARLVLHELEVSQFAIPLVDEVEDEEEYYTSWHWRFEDTSMTRSSVSAR